MQTHMTSGKTRMYSRSKMPSDCVLVIAKVMGTQALQHMHACTHTQALPPCVLSLAQQLASKASSAVQQVTRSGHTLPRSQTILNFTDISHLVTHPHTRPGSPVFQGGASYPPA
jgi:hypothetical protein